MSKICLIGLALVGGLACSGGTLGGGAGIGGGPGGAKGGSSGARGGSSDAQGGASGAQGGASGAQGGASGSAGGAAGNRDAGVQTGAGGSGVDGGPVACWQGGFTLGSLAAVPGAAMAQGDFNRDGKLDVAGVGTLLLGNGDGTFAAAPNFTLASGARAVVAGDVNKDGKLDLVVANYVEYVASTSSVSVFLGNGDGTFAAKKDYPAGDGAYSVAIGDVDGDGDLDIVTANDLAGTLSVLLGKGDGTFAAKKDYTVGNGPRAPLIGDFNGDGKTDLAVFNRKDGTVSVLPGKGDGTFAAKVDTVTLGDATSAWASAATGDLNADGKLDVVVATYLGSVSVLLGKGDGTFTASAENPGVEYFSTTALIDVDGDHKLDLVLTVTYAGAVSIQLGNGDGTFAAPQYYPASGFIAGAVLGDLNGDGRLDMAMSNVNPSVYNGNTVSVRLGTGAGSFATSLEYQAGGPVAAQALRDLNGDGKLDIVTLDAIAGTVHVLLGTGAGAFGAAMAYPLGTATSASGLGALAIGDVNGDGKPDIAAVEPSSATLFVLVGKGDGTFSGPKTFPTAPSPSALALGDMNGDGKLDVATASSGNGGTTDKGEAGVLLGDGQGNFAASVNYPTGVGTDGVALGDLDGDGKLDIVVANLGLDDWWSVGVLRGKGDGTFAAEVEFPSGFGPNSLALGDVNKDGKLDVVMTNATAGGSVSVLLGNGDGTLAMNVDTYIGESAVAVTLGDVDGDHNVDVVAIGDGSVVVLLGKGDGTFPTSLAFAAHTSSLSLGDLNGDGRTDVVVAATPSSVGVLLNTACR
jgi:hypothetical protein